MNEANLIKNQLRAVGNTVYLSLDDWTSMPFKAVVNHLWRKKTSAFTAQPTEIGQVNPQYYLYVGPADHDITALGRDVILLCEDGKYKFRRMDAVRKNNEVLYFTGVLERLEEAEYEEY